MVNNSTKRTITSHPLNINKTTTYDVAKTKVLLGTGAAMTA
jgi:hypothetical protein